MAKIDKKILLMYKKYRIDFRSRFILFPKTEQFKVILILKSIKNYPNYYLLSVM